MHCSQLNVVVFTFWPFIVIGLCISACLQEICDSIEKAVIFCQSSYYPRMTTIKSNHFLGVQRVQLSYNLLMYSEFIKLFCHIFLFMTGRLSS